MSLLAYEGEARTLLHRWKFGGADDVLGPIAEVLASMLDAQLLAGGAVTWVPTSAARRRGRGRDQAAALAASLARHTSLPRRALLARAPGPAQTGRSRAERFEGPGFAAIDSPPAAVLLADDVLTTGATLASAAGALRRAGASRVIGVTIARTPDRVTAQ